MDEYKKPYKILFVACADAIDLLRTCQGELALVKLIKAMQDAEEAYMDYQDIDE